VTTNATPSLSSGKPCLKNCRFSRALPCSKAMKLLVWNIQQGGGPRRSKIADRLRFHDADVVVLVEFIPDSAGTFPELSSSPNWPQRYCTNRNGDDYSLCILSKDAWYRHAGQNAVARAKWTLAGGVVYCIRLQHRSRSRSDEERSQTALLRCSRRGRKSPTRFPALAGGRLQYRAAPDRRRSEVPWRRATLPEYSEQRIRRCLAPVPRRPSRIQSLHAR
jgi:hypothetical protein